MLRSVDADTHIFESPQVWDFMDDNARKLYGLPRSGV